ncbi:unnamed protein product [Ixodes persulcatus]
MVKRGIVVKTRGCERAFGLPSVTAAKSERHFPARTSRPVHAHTIVLPQHYYTHFHCKNRSKKSPAPRQRIAMDGCAFQIRYMSSYQDIHVSNTKSIASPATNQISSELLRAA